MPIPYLGSKRKSAGKIYSTIRNLNPEAKILVDLFCGGFALSEYFYKRGWTVISNDKNKYVVALLNKTINEGLDEDIVTKFITRERFIEVLQNPDNHDEWYVGYVMCVWSFGNNQKGYLFGKDVEPIKHAGHELVINKDATLINKLISTIPDKYIQGILSLDNWHKRRLALAQVSHKLKTRVLELERLQQLQRLEQLERLERLEITSRDYRQVNIPRGAVVYCDPPYQNTGEYHEGGFNHDEFWQWVRDISKTNKIYISEYKAPDDFRKVLQFSQRSTYAGGNNSGQPDECLFTYNG